MSAGHLWAARCACMILWTPNSVSREPQAWGGWTHPEPNSPATSHHYTQAHFSPGKQKYSSSRYFISVLGEQAAVIFNSFQTCPWKQAVTACRWQGCCSHGKCNVGWHCLCCWNHALGTHVTLTKGCANTKPQPSCHGHLWYQMNILCVTLKRQQFCEQPVTGLCNFGITFPVHILSQKKTYSVYTTAPKIV